MSAPKRHDQEPEATDVFRNQNKDQNLIESQKSESEVQEQTASARSQESACYPKPWRKKMLGQAPGLTNRSFMLTIFVFCSKRDEDSFHV